MNPDEIMTEAEPECPFPDGTALALLWRESLRLRESVKHKETMASDYERKARNLRDRASVQRSEAADLDVAIAALDSIS